MGIQLVGARDAAECLPVNRTVTHYKELVGPNINSVEVEKAYMNQSKEETEENDEKNQDFAGRES